MGLEYGCFGRKERLKLFYIVLESFETMGVFFVILMFCWKFQSSRLCFVFFALFYSQSWCPLLMLEVLKSWMAITFIHERWRWNFSCMNFFCRRSPLENYCHQKLNFEGLSLKEALLNTTYSWKMTNWLKEQFS